MKKYMFLLVIIILYHGMLFQPVTVQADNRTDTEEPSDLYGISALLMDGKTGEVLFAKNGEQPLPIASTTKILTCILAIENGTLEDKVKVSEYAAAQPDVRMGVEAGEVYVLSDLLKGMMLESYNDVSVAVAEHIGGSVDEFSDLMNKKAEALGCTDSYFITPNGLDEEKGGRKNYSTAKDLAQILSYAIKNDAFLEIVQTQVWVISECNGKRDITAENKNRFLQEYEGLIAGKTGYTSKAGYCYAGAALRDDRLLVAVTLGCGWPPNKNYKWSDMRSLFDYGYSCYEYREIDYQGVALPESFPISNGADKKGKAVTAVSLEVPQIEKRLVKKGEDYYGRIYVKKELKAPIDKGQILGRIEVYQGQELIEEKNILAADSVVESKIWYKIWQKLCYLFDKNI